jgi:4-amino-4-deoxy-L-arabinose transferase-like glycosyltransferase
MRAGLRRNASLLFIAGALLLIGFALRVYQLNDSELVGVTNDEGWTYQFIRQTYPGIVERTFFWNEPHPVGSYFLYKTWVLFAGESAFSIRLLSAAFGVLAIALTWRLCGELGLTRWSVVVPVVASALMALSPIMVAHSREMRMYAMLVALTLASSVLMLVLLRKPSPRVALGYAAMSWLALQVHHYAAFILIGQNAFVLAKWLIFKTDTHAWRKQWLIIQTMLWLAAVPWYVAARQLMTSYGGTARTATLPEVIAGALQFFTAGRTGVDADWPFVALGAAVCLLGLLALFRRRALRQSAIFLLLYLGVTLLLAWLAAQSRPIYRERYVIAAAPALFVLAGAGMGWLAQLLRQRPALPAQRRTLVAGIGGVLAIGLVIGNASALPEAMAVQMVGWWPLVRTFDRYGADLPRSEFRAAINYPDLSFDFYYKQPYVILPPREGDEASAMEAVRRLKAEGVKRVALQLIGPSYWDDRNIATTALTQEFTQVEEVFTGKWIVRVFGRRDLDELQAMSVTFSNGVQLASALVLPNPAAALVEVHTHWSGPSDALTGSEKLFVHIYDPANALIAQLDLPFRAGMLAKPVNTHGIRLPENLLPGAYRVAIGLYDPAQPGATRLLTDDGRDAVELAQFVVPGE